MGGITAHSTNDGSAGKVSASLSYSTAIDNGNNWTSEWVDVSAYGSVVVAVKTDQNGYFEIQFSPDGTNQDSTLTRYYNTTSIEAPHRFTITRQYCRIAFYNDSGSNQTSFRLQTILGQKQPLNVPIDAVVSRDYDATMSRTLDHRYDVGAGRRQGWSTWNKFGYNPDIDTGTETIWAAGGTWTRMAAAEALTITSSSAQDASGGTGMEGCIIYGVDANWNLQTVVETDINGLTGVTTTETWLGVNRVAGYTHGSGEVNAGNITVSSASYGTQAYLVAGEGVTQQCIFFVPADYQFLATWLFINVNKISGGASPVVTVKGWVYSDVSGGKYEVFRETIDTSVENTIELVPSEPFVIGEKSVLWFEATTNSDNTIANCRFSGELVANPDAP